MHIKDVYTLKRKDIPEIVDGTVLSDPDVGGEKLVYWRRTFMIKEICIGSIKISYPVKAFKRKKVVFLRPYKKYWDTKGNRLPLNYWGKKNHPLTNMWITVQSDYKQWSDKVVRFKDQVTDHGIIKSLKSAEETFSSISLINSNIKT